MKKLILQSPELIPMVLGSLVYMGVVGIWLPLGADDLRMTNVFSIDESDIVAHVWNLFATDFQVPPSFKYGGLFYFVPVGFMHLWGLFFEVTEQTAVIAVRLYCCLAGLGCLWVLYAVGQILFNGWVGVLAAWMLGANATFLRWTTESHPDLPQLLFLLLSVYYICVYVQEHRQKYLVFSVLAAGLAFATKYAGLFLLPVLGYAVFLSFQNTPFWVRFQKGELWVRWIIMGAVFCGTAFVTNPQLLTHFSEFLGSLRAEKETMAFGHRVRATTGAWVWLQMLATQVGFVHILVLFVGGVLWFLKSDRKLTTSHQVVLMWIILFLVYLMVESSLKRGRHLLPVLPFVLTFVGAGYWVLWGVLKERVQGLSNKAWVVFVLGLALTWPQFQASAILFNQRVNRESDRVEIEVGRWLSDQYAEDTRIVFDAYAYIPSKFPYVFRSVGMDYTEVNHFEPDLLVVRDAIASDYANLSEAESSRMGAVPFKDRHYFYQYLRAGKIPTYRLVKDFESVAVYERTVPKIRENEDGRALWRKLMVDYVNQRRYGVVGALWTMGYLHQEAGLMAMAEADFVRAERSQNFTKRLYSHGVFMLKNGHEDLARHALGAALYKAREESKAFQAGMREDLAYRFFEMGLYQDMLETAQGALELSDNLPAAAFEEATAYLALGKYEKGQALFDAAVSKYGKHEKGNVLLTLLTARNLAIEAVDKLKRRYYVQ